MSNILIRSEKTSDFFAVENLVRESFYNVYMPGAFEHYVLHQMRKLPDFLPELSLVLEYNEEIIGQIAFLKTNILLDSGKLFPVLTFGPFCIAKKFQKKGFGKLLLEDALKKATEKNFNAVFIEGDKNFYFRSGFHFAFEYLIRYDGVPPETNPEFFLAKELKPNSLQEISGIYKTPDVYFSAIHNPKDFEVFDKNFPEKEKSVQPGQIF